MTALTSSLAARGEYAGPGRYLDLELEQNGDEVTAHIPTEPARAVDGYYILFALVDDIPSEGVMVRVAE